MIPAVRNITDLYIDRSRFIAKDSSKFRYCAELPLTLVPRQKPETSLKGLVTLSKNKENNQGLWVDIESINKGCMCVNQHSETFEKDLIFSVALYYDVAEAV